MTRMTENGGMSPTLRLLSQRILSIPFAITIVWLFTLWWGERLVFENSVSACRWSNWERWVRMAQRATATLTHIL